MYFDVGIFLHFDEYICPAVGRSAITAEELLPEFCGYVFCHSPVSEKPYQFFMQKREYQVLHHAGGVWDTWYTLQFLCG